MSFRNVKIGLRAGLSFAALAILVVVLGVTTLGQMKRMDSMSDAIESKWFPSTLALNELSTATLRIRALTLRLYILEDDQARRAALGAIDGAKADLERVQTRYAELVDSEAERALYQRLVSVKERYMKHQVEVVDLLLSGQRDRARAVITGVMAEEGDTIVSELQGLTEFNRQGAAQASAESESVYGSGNTIVVSAVLIATLLTLFLAIFFTRSIVRPLSKAVGVAQTIAAGDLTHAFSDDGHDEPAQLLQALAVMQGSLRGTLQQIADSSNQLASASEELHAVTEDSTRGLHQQNNEIEQAATAVNQMTAAVEEVAQNAVSTSEASRESDSNARVGQNQVRQTVDSIHLLAQDVTSTSDEVGKLAGNVRNISQVVNVIRSIAEQTNLLALNAAIEAARAGEQGRGFAVVADEVRALAHRTQQSTQEIEQMIETVQQGTEHAVRAMESSSVRTESTLSLAQSAGQALDGIVQAIGSINERNLVIASASEQQAQVAREVDRNLVNIRDLSLQTSAGANQTSAASQELSRLAVSLNGLVAGFRV
ncbi:methyl-accepting chemotaxis protein [Pseudomonas sp. BIGb0408]|uniref:Methyl-accepting chemotaxis protein n=2 Tax=Phytopseudomonas flavescens TaxID=29435 RepID=A0A7Z0BQB0_9GAMM|nr:MULTISPECIES: methyl-accepting chemotaxis protein [Pseudomonas]MCW2291685.1 methyl-accepting chemotaxis protein [Pseudomonas sp. BIGb0408]NYH73744.1 methyl-accepting chemotaxis protein [Pseudomonas flavescens]